MIPNEQDREQLPEPQQSVGYSRENQNILGLSTSELAGLSVDELLKNKTALTMMLHYYNQLVDQNNTLRTEVNSLRTYQQGYETTRVTARTGAVLLTVSNVGIGFGVNLLTNNQTWPGIATLTPALAFAAVGLYLSWKER